MNFKIKNICKSVKPGLERRGDDIANKKKIFFLFSSVDLICFILDFLWITEEVWVSFLNKTFFFLEIQTLYGE